MLPTAIAFAILAALPASAHKFSPGEAADRDVALAKIAAHNSMVDMSFADTGNTSAVFQPYRVDCPSDITWVRPATNISEGETKYLQQRAPHIDAAVTKLLKDVGLTKPARNPVIGISMSGGGYRAMIETLGQAQGLMNGSTATGGWMDAVSYMVGLSGGSWATAAYAATGGMKPTDQAREIWDLQDNLITGPANGSSTFYAEIAKQVQAKADLGFPVQITDIWGLALGEHLLPKDYRLASSPNMTISQLASTVPAFANASIPMPIIVAAAIDSIAQKLIPQDAPVYEFTPFEFGTWDSSNKTEGGYFAPVEWLGSDPKNGTCWHGYDQLSFIAGTSATLFNALPFPASSLFPAQSFPFLNPNTSSVATVPSPFEGYNGTEHPDPTESDLTLVDAGETSQNLPLLPLLVPQRKVDAIIALDASGDVGNWPNGNALYTTYNATANSSDVHMPKIPSVRGFVNGGLNTRPVFFGCNDTEGPLLIYVPNYPWQALSNISTFTFTQDINSTVAQVESTMMSMTLNGTVDAWPTCLACALTDRATGAANRSESCTKCFSAFCWDGVDNTTVPNSPYTPPIGVPAFLQNLKIDLPKQGGKGNGAAALGTGAAFTIFSAVLAAWVAL